MPFPTEPGNKAILLMADHIGKVLQLDKRETRSAAFIIGRAGSMLARECRKRSKAAELLAEMLGKTDSVGMLLHPEAPFLSDACAAVIAMGIAKDCVSEEAFERFLLHAQAIFDQARLANGPLETE